MTRRSRTGRRARDYVTTGPCSHGCGGTSDPFKNMGEVASHELVETVTDPDGGSSWLDPSSQSCGEIGDICAGIAGTAAGYTVQKQWSNKQGACVDHDPSVVVNDFTLSLDASTAVAAGASGSAALSASPTTGSNAITISLSVSGLPSGATGTFSASSIMSNASAPLTLKVASSVAPGSYPYAVTASGSGVSHTANGTLKVTPPQNMPDMGAGGADAGSGLALLGGIPFVLLRRRRRRA